MSYQEGRIVAYLLSTLTAAGTYTFFAWRQYQQGAFESGEINSFWGILMLSVIGLNIVLAVVTTVVLTVVQAVATQDEDPIIADERDQLIEHKGDRLAYTLFGIGFVLSMVALSFGVRPLVMFNMIVYSLFISTIVSSLSQWVSHRRGF